MAIQAVSRLKATAPTKTKQVADVDAKGACKIIESAFAAEGIRIKARTDNDDPTYIYCSGRADGLVNEPFDFTVFLDKGGKNARIFFDFLNMPGMNNNSDLYSEEFLPDTLTTKKKVDSEGVARAMEKFVANIERVVERAQGMQEFARRFTKAMGRLQKLMVKNASTK